MKKISLVKLGFAALIAASTMLAPKTAHAAGSLCVYSYTLADGTVCTYAGQVNGCCVYTGSPHCHKICTQ
jgi:hypothetical protein